MISAKELALSLPAKAWHTVTWRDGTSEPLASRFARLRVCIAGRHAITVPEWLLIEWPKDESEPTKYWLSTLPEDMAFDRLVDLAKLRWRIERDYHDLKQEIGLGHFEGRGWRGFHHHATLCIAAYGFLIGERETIPPQQLVPALASRQLAYPKVTSRGVPLRPERHIPNSIATMRRQITVALARKLSRCPCCTLPPLHARKRHL